VVRVDLIVEKLGLAPWQPEDLAEIDFEVIVGNRLSVLPVETPVASVGQHTPAQPSPGHCFGAIEVMHKLRRRHALLAAFGAIERSVPALCLNKCRAVAKALPSLEAACCGVGGAVRK